MSTPAATQPSLADRLGPVRVSLRSDLEVSRHVFRGAVAYVIRDPVTFQSQRFDPHDYDLLVRLDARQTLSETATKLIALGKLRPDECEGFYRFVLQLHKLSFLSLPISDGPALYERHQLKARAQRKARSLGFLFLRIPVWNPDAFLSRTLDRVRPLLGGKAFAVWCLLMVTAGWIAINRRDELTQPLQGVLAAQNLPLLWISLILLKILHEFGHAFLCKRFGGQVPEMGIYLIVFTPCAYVDATACWGFTSKWKRLAVNFGGMYVESAVAAVAMVVWAWVESPIIRSAAYNVVFLAGLVTVLFNINPLMRFDGYYILSDLLEIPNLRSRSSAYLRRLAKRGFLGLRISDAAQPPLCSRLGMIYLAFGVASCLYRVSLIVGISALLATKILVVGIAVGMAYVLSTAWSIGRKLHAYLWHNPETQPVRVRAMALGIVVFVAFPLGLVLIPVPQTVTAMGVVTLHDVASVRAESSGFLQDITKQSGDRVAQYEVLAQLSNDDVTLRHLAAETEWHIADLTAQAFQGLDPTRAAQAQARSQAKRDELQRLDDHRRRLTVRAPMEGIMIRSLEPRSAGEFLNVGDPIATIGRGGWIVQCLVTEQELVRSRAQTGAPITLRLSAFPTLPIPGTIERIEPAGSKAVHLAPLTHVAGGSVVVNPLTNQSSIPYFVIQATFDPDSAAPGFELRDGMTAMVHLDAHPETLAIRGIRGILRFVQNLQSNR